MEEIWQLVMNDYMMILTGWGIGYLLLAAARDRGRWLQLFNMFQIISFLGYLLFLLYGTLFGRQKFEEFQYELSFLWEYRLAFQGSRIWFTQIWNNIIMFVPLGMFYGEQRCWKSGWCRALLAGCICSGMIEILQLVLKLGLFEFDDILNNSIGMMIGYGLTKIRRRKRRLQI